VKRKEVVIDCEFNPIAVQEVLDRGKAEFMKCKIYEDGEEVGYFKQEIRVEDEKFRTIIKTNYPEYFKEYLRSLERY